MALYRVRVRETQAGKEESRCLLGISVGQETHEAEKLRTLFSWVSNRFSSAHIWIADELHRHNRQFGYGETPEEATQQSRDEGERWMTRNRAAFENLTLPYTLSRWQQWLLDTRYPHSRQAMQTLYETLPELRAAAIADAEGYINRLNRRGIPISDLDVAKEKSIELILEENAVFPLLLEDYGGIDIYPGSELKSTVLLRKLPLPPVLQPLYERKFIRVWFQRR